MHYSLERKHERGSNKNKKGKSVKHPEILGPLHSSFVSWSCMLFHIFFKKDREKKNQIQLFFFVLGTDYSRIDQIDTKYFVHVRKKKYV